MKHVIIYDLFESEDTYTLDDVRQLPLYKMLISMGWQDSTTRIQEKNKTLAFDPGNLPTQPYTIHSNGYIRKY